MSVKLLSLLASLLRHSIVGLWQNVNLTPLCLLSLIQITICQNLMVCRCSLIMVNSGTRVYSVLICFENHLVPASAPEHTDRRGLWTARWAWKQQRSVPGCRSGARAREVEQQQCYLVLGSSAMPRVAPTRNREGDLLSSISKTIKQMAVSVLWFCQKCGVEFVILPHKKMLIVRYKYTKWDTSN